MDEKGEYRWSTVRAVPLRMPDGSVREWVGTFSDVHDQRLAQEQLAASEERLRLATEVTGLGTYSVDLRTGVREWSESMRALLGISHDEPIGFEVFAARVHPEDFEWTHSRYAALQSEGIPFHAEFRIIRADNGEVRWVSGTSGMLRDESGNPARIVGSLQDVTDRKLTELALQESETRYRLLAETATDLILRTDLAGRCLYASHAAESILGFAPLELVGAEPKIVVHPEDIAQVWSGFQALVKGEIEQETATYRVRHKQGHWVWVEARRRLVQDGITKPQEVVSIVRDITERQHLEQQLRRSQRLEAIGQLTGGIAHDFNNLLTVILGNAEFLGEALPDPRLRSQANMIQEAAERGASLTQHLLAFARRQTLKPEHTDLCEVVKEMESLLRRTIRENIHFTADCGAEDAIASTDRALVETAILNLVLNARDAMPNGGTLNIRVGQATSDRVESGLLVGDPVVFVEVTDTGIGMSPEVLERVF
jgi:PAS domain S-box-containing protein